MPPVVDSPPLDDRAVEVLSVALADATRCRILARLTEGPAYPAELATALGTTRANVSNHLARLRGCGLVRGTPEGRRVRYRLASPGLADALRRLVAALTVDGQGHEPAAAAPAPAAPPPAPAPAAPPVPARGGRR